MKRSRLAIIGGGCSGALVAIHLLRHAASAPFEIFIVERAETVGRGLAYNVPSDRCKLNVPANAMGADPEDPAGFFTWLMETGHSCRGEDFVSRDLYGQYLSNLLAHTLARAADATLTHVRDEACDITFNQATSEFHITLAKHPELTVDLCVLALGNMARSSLNGVPVAKTFRSPYTPSSYDDVSELQTLLVIGTGLTAVDSILEAEGRGFTGRYTMVSRHGYLPLPHEALDPAIPATLHPTFSSREQLLALSLRELTRLVTRESRRIGSSQPCITALRPHIQRIWSGLSLPDKKRFLRHLRPLWEIHRHRIPAQHWQRLQDLIEAGRLTIHAGSIRSATRSTHGVAIQVSPPLTACPASFDAAFMCAGPEGDLAKIDLPLVKNLLAHGILARGELGLGADLSRSSLPFQARAKFKIIGPLQREALWEITAVRELRSAAAQLAQEIAATCSHSPCPLA
jgi:uncharacterized NAD(P)/FAD-binding protein YdhS